MISRNGSVISGNRFVTSRNDFLISQNPSVISQNSTFSPARNPLWIQFLSASFPVYAGARVVIVNLVPGTTYQMWARAIGGSTGASS
jgi:hypothetical protein